jgi:anti-anti-sigma regulatory factor
MDRLAGGQPVALDGSCVGQVDTIGLQILAAALQSAAGAGLDWCLSAPSAALRDHARAAGLEQALSL